MISFGTALLRSTGATASENGSATTLETGKNGGKNILARLTATKNSGTTPTLDVAIQHSPDGVNWATIGSFTQVTTETDHIEDLHFTQFSTIFFPVFRAVSTLGGTSPNYDIDVVLYVD